MRNFKKGIIQINEIVPILVTLLIIAFVIGITVIAGTELRNDLITGAGTTDNETNAAFQSVNNTIASVFNLSEQLPLFGTIIGLFIILGVIFLLVRSKVSIQ